MNKLSEKAEKRKVGWKQFLQNKISMLNAYEVAKASSSAKPVKVDHGIVAEAEFRKWLKSFLPKRYGVTSGYLVTQGDLQDDKLRHFDVIIYDQFECPILWTDSNPDTSETGESRAIPVEYVRGIMEIKSKFNRESVKAALNKLNELTPYLSRVDAPNERYKKFLPLDFYSAIVFFELEKSQEYRSELLDMLMNIETRGFYGATILFGEGKNINDTAWIKAVAGESSIQSSVKKNSSILVSGFFDLNTNEINGKHHKILIAWTDQGFAFFAFDVLALTNGTYNAGRLSSFHGTDFGIK